MRTNKNVHYKWIIPLYYCTSSFLRRSVHSYAFAANSEWDICNTDMRDPCESVTDLLPNCGITVFLGCEYVLKGTVHELRAGLQSIRVVEEE